MANLMAIAAIVIGTSLAATNALAQEPTYDLVINGGRVMDPETMYDAVANVGIKDGRIAAITKDSITGKETIDAMGLVVAPGFIDPHFHAVDPFATKMSLRDGVTTGMDLELGALHVGAWYDKKAKDGWHARILRMGREQGVPLMFSVAQLSYWSALHLGNAGLEAMKERGRVQVGKIADLTLFDPKTVTDHATYKAGENGLPSTGIPYVIVHGTIVVKDSNVLPVKPGQPVRYPVEAEGRFQPVSVANWINEKTILSSAYPKTPDDTGAGVELGNQ